MNDTFDESDHAELDPKILQILQKNDCKFRVRSFESKAHHASDAAELLGCPLGAIVKSLVFQNIENGHIALVLVSGGNRVDMSKLRQILACEIKPAKPAEIKRLTGFKVGAVPPIGVKTHYPVIIDADLMSYEVVWASAGTVYTLMQVKSRDLLAITNGRVEKLH